MESPRKVLFIAASGIGNTILATPLIQRAREIWPSAQFDLLTSRRTFQAPLRRSTLIRDFFDLEARVVPTLLSLRRKRYDISITCFPSNRWQFNIVAALIGARSRVSHSYREGNRFASLINKMVPANESLHDIEQNLGLLKPVSAEKIAEKASPLLFPTNQEDEKKVDLWLDHNSLRGKTLIGLHIGGFTPKNRELLMNRQIGAAKSPDAEAIQRDMREASPDTQFVFFGGPEEEHAIRAFIQGLPADFQSRSHRFSGDLWSTAALVARCSRFISGDTALMHIAAVYKIPQKAYFRCTNPSRTAPRNPNAMLVVEKGCAEYLYPFKLSS